VVIASVVVFMMLFWH